MTTKAERDHMGRPKFRYIRSEPLMAAYRTIPCQNCGKDDGTVCGAHSNWAVHGHGRAIKASDEFCASLCSDCHVPILDQGAHLLRFERQMMWWRAHVRSVVLLRARGAWPLSVNPPDVVQFPFGEDETADTIELLS